MDIGEPDQRDRRLYFRLHDTIVVDYKKVLQADLSKQPSSHFEGSRYFNLLTALQAIDLDTHYLFRHIKDHHLEIAEYLTAMNKKIETIAQTLEEEKEPLPASCHKEVTLSEQGLSFDTEETITPNSYLALRLILSPTNIGITVYGHVLRAQQQPNQLYRLHIRFVNTADHMRQLLARHIMQRQASKIRERDQNKIT